MEQDRRAANRAANIDRVWSYAYAIGYYHGRSKGEGVNPYDFESPERAAWWEGYDCGVGDYCRYDLNQIEEET